MINGRRSPLSWSFAAPTRKNWRLTDFDNPDRLLGQCGKCTNHLYRNTANEINSLLSSRNYECG